MKKEYMAPDLCFESFVLSQSIAAGCSTTGIQAAYDWNAGGYFNISNQDSRLDACTENWDDSIFEEYCYWAGDNKMFLS